MTIGKKVKYIVLGQTSPEFYRQNADKLTKENLHGLRLAALVTLLLEVLLLCGAVFVPTQCPAWPMYLCGLFFCVATLVAAGTLAPRHPALTRPMLYVFITVTEVNVIMAETFYAPDRPAVATFSALLVLSVVVLDRPLYPMLMTIAAEAAFCGMCLASERYYPDVLKSDIINACLTLVLALCFCSYVLNLRLKNLQAVQVLRSRSEMDVLTGIANKAAIERMCRAYLKTGRNEMCALLMLDVDGFKSINDTQGHAMGDEVLRSIGLTMHTMFREADIVGRFGGDEFLILMKNISDAKIAGRKAESLRSRLADIMVGGKPLGCSMGVAIAEAEEDITFDELFSHADMALYSSKSGGKNMITLYRESTQTTTRTKIHA